MKTHELSPMERREQPLGRVYVALPFVSLGLLLALWVWVSDWPWPGCSASPSAS
ncbi:hypothetical protein [Solidesulfovibrio sp.]|uniref:hypothetical protein n=1 Tax=Solidesulfovibrio sp. TaxID=2910990 RepID=UPI002B1F590C|nr:hypothetical protein [Solidesulfovibrio sp.]MEA4854956.1 hypothetical protein [Solidesulfovibrio sp.]